MSESRELVNLWRNPHRSIRGRFSALSQVLNVGALLLDENADIEFANPTTLDLLGVQEHEALGQTWNTAIEQGLRQRLLEMDSGDRPARGQIMALHDRQPIALRVEAYRLDEDDGSGFLVLLKAKNAGDILEADLVQASQMRNLVKRFTSATHEIRAPLNALSLTCHLLQTSMAESTLNLDEARGHAAVVFTELQRLNGLLNELLSETRPPVNQPTPFDMVMLIEEVCKLVWPYAESVGVKAQRHLGSEPIWINGYPDRLKQALLNIMNNAIEAMPEGGTLNLTLDNQPDQVRLVIADSGRGIPLEMIDDIFRLHYSTKKSGSGIGLYVARLVCESHGGDLDVQSQEGQGSVFTLTLPRV
jgi:signal transduction histidine kinase